MTEETNEFRRKAIMYAYAYAASLAAEAYDAAEGVTDYEIMFAAEDAARAADFYADSVQAQ